MESKGSQEFVDYCRNVFESGPFSGYKAELHIIHGKQAEVVVANVEKQTVTNFCSNNYTGLASDPRIVEAAKKTLDTHGFGLSSAPLM